MSVVTDPRSGLQTEIVPVTAGDGMALNLHHVTGPVAPTKGPVILSHGAGVRADIFRPPGQTTLVDLLIEDGWDVWLENWRASIDLQPNQWTLDEAARYDHPALVGHVVEATGADSVKAIIHCQGSTSFAMSAVAGLLPQVDTIVANAVTLHPVISAKANAKIQYASPLVAKATAYVNPRWGIHAPTLLSKAIVGFVRATHRECDHPVCRLVSFTYGVGFPALWAHANLRPEVHDWVEGEFAECPMTFFDQMARSVRRGHMVSLGVVPDLPTSFVAEPPRTDARFALFAGEDNSCFRAESQRRTFAYLDGLRPNFHSLHVIPGYGHLDMFFGARAATDVLPLMIKELSA